MGKHLLDETAEFKMPQIGRHAADDEGGRETTHRPDTGLQHEDRTTQDTSVS